MDADYLVRLWEDNEWVNHWLTAKQARAIYHDLTKQLQERQDLRPTLRTMPSHQFEHLGVDWSTEKHVREHSENRPDPADVLKLIADS